MPTECICTGERCDLDFSIQRVGGTETESPLHHICAVSDDDAVCYFTDVASIQATLDAGKPLPKFERAGPRRRIAHDPARSCAAIVTCGGLCPGLNDVIKAIVNTLFFAYGVHHVLGIRYGYRGLVSAYDLEPIKLDPDVVDLIHGYGGSILGSSRGRQDTDEIVNTLERRGINLLFCIGGDGTLRGVRDIAECAAARNLSISIIGVPKTIDNDIGYMEKTFGFETAVYAAAPIISSAHQEAKDVFNGIGLVRLMGRDSGFIAAYATLANSVVNFCLIPEVRFTLEGPNGFLSALERRMLEKNHAVVVVAEGAGQDLFDRERNKDASGNHVHHDIGLYLKAKIQEHLTRRNIEHAIKYFDPSYIIRSVPAQGTDAVFCLHLAENVVHAAMAGRTNMVVGYWNGQFVHVPIALATRERRKINPLGQLWQSVLGVTRQEHWSVSRE